MKVIMKIIISEFSTKFFSRSFQFLIRITHFNFDVKNINLNYKIENYEEQFYILKLYKKTFEKIINKKDITPQND